QTLLLCVVVFCIIGMNTAITTMGAGGSHPYNIPIIDRVNVVVGVMFIIAGSFGNVNNKLGPKWTLMLGASGYPVYVGALWWLDQGKAPAFIYCAGVYHGLCGGLFYTTLIYIGYVAASYATEQHRGKYIAATSSFIGLGSAVGSGTTHVPSAVYMSIIVIQSVGFVIAALLQSPEKVRRNDGQAIAHFKPATWRQELVALPKSILTPAVLLVSLALFSSQMNLSLTGSLNAFYFNIRTRALANFCFWLASACGSGAFGFICDNKWFGHRRRRAMIASAIMAVIILGPHSGFLAFLSNHNLNRHASRSVVDWKEGNPFTKLFFPYICLGFTSYIFQNYLIWLLATFTNEPTVLSRYSGYVEATKALGLIVANAVDSKKTPFLTEEITYLSLNVAGLVLCIISTIFYTTDTKYGEEESVIIPRDFLFPENSACGPTNVEISTDGSKEKVNVSLNILGSEAQMI
ncbi:hypothetical protein N431DRAFT_322617, partial [Stipitochalara longipes BDJ]